MWSPPKVGFQAVLECLSRPHFLELQWSALAPLGGSRESFLWGFLLGLDVGMPWCQTEVAIITVGTVGAFPNPPSLPLHIFITFYEEYENRPTAPTDCPWKCIVEDRRLTPIMSPMRIGRRQAARLLTLQPIWLFIYRYVSRLEWNFQTLEPNNAIWNFSRRPAPPTQTRRWGWILLGTFFD